MGKKIFPDCPLTLIECRWEKQRVVSEEDPRVVEYRCKSCNDVKQKVLRTGESDD